MASATALLRSADEGAAAAGDAEAAPWRKVLRGVGADGLAAEVRRLAAAVSRIAAVSAAVAGPVVYAPLLSALKRQRGS